MRQFAEQEIVLQSGPRAGEQYRCKYQPYTQLWFDAIGSGLFRIHVATGPSQSGKTLTCSIIPTMYHLFEMRETVIFFAPTMEINENKWLLDIRPAIEASRFARFLPSGGHGSNGGFSELIIFKNGTGLKFMTGGGGDKNKAAFTARVAVGTEIDGMDKASDTSREADPLRQISARLRSYGERAVEYHECTVSIETGRIWKELKEGTDSRIAIQCPHCSGHVSPERDDFLGWENAKSEIEAEEIGRFYCPSCGGGWSPQQREAANRNLILVHKGQTIVDGAVVGPMPETRTFGFRWSAVNNLFATEAILGNEEWKSARNPDRESAEKERHQFVWCIPWRGEAVGEQLTEAGIASRLTGLDRCVCPNDTDTLVAQIDVHNKWLYWAVMATSTAGARSIVDYGITKTPETDAKTPTQAIIAGLWMIKDELENKPWRDVSGEKLVFDRIHVDSPYEQDAVLQFCTEAGSPWWPSMGSKGGSYTHPKERTPVLIPGNHWHLAKQPAHVKTRNKPWWLAKADTDYWMRQVHGGLATEAIDAEGKRVPGSLAFFGSDPLVHQDSVDKTIAHRTNLSAQLLAWRWQVMPKKEATFGWVGQYSKDGRDDHWFDCIYWCFVTDQIARSLRTKPAAPPKVDEKPKFTMPDGRPYLLTER